MCITYCFLRVTNERKLTLEEASNEQRKLLNDIKGIYKGVKPERKRFFVNF